MLLAIYEVMAILAACFMGTVLFSIKYSNKIQGLDDQIKALMHADPEIADAVIKFKTAPVAAILAIVLMSGLCWPIVVIYFFIS